MLLVCAFVLIPIVMVMFGSFKSVNEFFSKPYSLPKHWDFTTISKAWEEANIHGHDAQ